MTVEDARAWVREHWRDPVFWTDVIQLVKTVVAAVIAWVIATDVLQLPQSFLAPWSALLVVHATVYRTFSQGARQLGAVVLGVFLAWAVGNFLGLEFLAVGLVMLLGLLLGSFRWFGAETTTVAATALIVLTTGFADDNIVLLSRLADTAIGIGVGLIVNFVVWPPLRRRTAIRAIDGLDDRIGDLLREVGDGLAAGVTSDDVDDWIERTEEIDEEVDHAWSLVRQARESALMNPRRSASELRDPREWISLLQRVEQALADTRSMVRTLLDDVLAESQWQESFKKVYIEVLCEAGEAVRESDRDRLARCRGRLDELVAVVDRESSTPRLWPVYGALVVNLRNIMEAMDEVAAANPMSQPPVLGGRVPGR
jgi:uncharacterized membrane protein YccC